MVAEPVKKVTEEDWRKRAEGAFLNKMLGQGLNKKVTFEQQSKLGSVQQERESRGFIDKPKESLSVQRLRDASQSWESRIPALSTVAVKVTDIGGVFLLQISSSKDVKIASKQTSGLGIYGLK